MGAGGGVWLKSGARGIEALSITQRLPTIASGRWWGPSARRCVEPESLVAHVVVLVFDRSWAGLDSSMQAILCKPSCIEPSKTSRLACTILLLRLRRLNSS